MPFLEAGDLEDMDDGDVFDVFDYDCCADVQCREPWFDEQGD